MTEKARSQAHTFQPSQVWESPRGTAYRVASIEDPGTAVLYEGADGSGRVYRKRQEDTHGWLLIDDGLQGWKADGGIDPQDLESDSYDAQRLQISVDTGAITGDQWTQFLIYAELIADPWREGPRPLHDTVVIEPGKLYPPIATHLGGGLFAEARLTTRESRGRTRLMMEVTGSIGALMTLAIGKLQRAGFTMVAASREPQGQPGSTGSWQVLGKRDAAVHAVLQGNARWPEDSVLAVTFAFGEDEAADMLEEITGVAGWRSRLDEMTAEAPPAREAESSRTETP